MKTSFVSLLDVGTVTQHSRGSYNICFREEAPKVLYEDHKKLLNIRDCISKDQAAFH
ncbi:hypothetical protein Hanom_Chr02g00156181 [Helianthus anomalus]